MNAPRVGDRLPDAVLEATVRDHEGQRAPLAGHVLGKICVLVFLRHFGCVGCNAHVARIAPRLTELHALGVRVVFVGNGEPMNIDAFMARHGLSHERVTVVSDPELHTYRAAGLRRAVLATIGAEALWAQLRAFGRGYRQRRGDGDAWQQGGAIVCDADGVVAHVHRSEHVADNADPGALVEAALGLVTRVADAAHRGIV